MRARQPAPARYFLLSTTPVASAKEKTTTYSVALHWINTENATACTKLDTHTVQALFTKENMIALMGSQDKVIAMLRSVAGIVERRHTLPCLANAMLRGNAISNGFPEQGGGGAEQAEAGDEGAGAADGAPDVAQDDDDGDGDGDSDSDRRRPRSKKSPPSFPPALLGFAPLSHYVGFNRSRIYALIGAGQFPRPIKVGKSSRWIKTEIDSWISHQSQQRAEV